MTGLPDSDTRWMKQALRLARAAGRRGEVPVGAVVIRDGGFLAGGGNLTISRRDPSAHAEIVALRRASSRAGNHRLTGATLYVTLEPCVMCVGAMIQARIARLVYAASDPKTGATALSSTARFRRLTNHRFEVKGGTQEEESSRLLRDFFNARRSRSGG